jgi:hypothetical protein
LSFNIKDKIDAYTNVDSCHLFTESNASQSNNLNLDFEMSFNQNTQNENSNKSDTERFNKLSYNQNSHGSFVSEREDISCIETFFINYLHLSTIIRNYL